MKPTSVFARNQPIILHLSGDPGKLKANHQEVELLYSQTIPVLLRWKCYMMGLKTVTCRIRSTDIILCYMMGLKTVLLVELGALISYYAI